jgi:predicted nucleic-acid-binding Zn-ribbon protein
MKVISPEKAARTVHYMEAITRRFMKKWLNYYHAAYWLNQAIYKITSHKYVGFRCKECGKLVDIKFTEIYTLRQTAMTNYCNIRDILTNGEKFITFDEDKFNIMAQGYVCDECRLNGKSNLLENYVRDSLGISNDTSIKVGRVQHINVAGFDKKVVGVVFGSEGIKMYVNVEGSPFGMEW